MTPRKRRYFRNAATTLVLILVNRMDCPAIFQRRTLPPLVRTALEKALHRKITFGHIAVHLFPQPGFTIDSVVVEEAPSFGLEPFARVQSIDCELLWRSLWQGGLEFGTLQLDHPSINLVRNAHGQWNIENLLSHSEIAGPPTAAGRPARPCRPSELKRAAPGSTSNCGRTRSLLRLSTRARTCVLTLPRAAFASGYRVTRSGRIWNCRPRARWSWPGPGNRARRWAIPLMRPSRPAAPCLYDWIPLVTGYNPGVYGVLETSIHLTGTLRKIAF